MLTEYIILIFLLLLSVLINGEAEFALVKLKGNLVFGVDMGVLWIASNKLWL